MNKHGWARALAGTALAALLTTVPLTAAAAADPTTSTSTAPATSDPFAPTPAGPPATATPASTTPAISDPFAPIPAEAAATAQVSIIDFGFSPASVTVAAGSTVRWVNSGAAIHSVTSDTGAFDSSPSCPAGPCIDPAGSYSHLFAQAGRFAYHCKVHPDMTGTVVVNATATTTTSTTAANGNSGNPPVTAAGSPTTTGANSDANGDELAFTGASPVEVWIALGALAIIALGLALRPRRRPFPDPS